MPSLRSPRKRRFNKCCCCNPLVLCSSMLGLRRSPLCKSSVGRCTLGTYLTILAARKPSSSSTTTKPLDQNIEENASSNPMANDPPAVNGNQNRDTVKAEKPAVIAKEPTVANPMVYEPNPNKKYSGLSNGTTSHSRQSMTRSMTTPPFKVFNLIADPVIIPQALNPIRVPPRAGANAVPYSQKTSRSQSFKRPSSQRDESSWRISIMLMIPTFIA